MASTHHSLLSYKELYGEPANNPFGIVEAKQVRYYRAVYDTWRAKGVPLTVGKLHQNIMVDLSRPIGGIGVFVADKESASGTLQVHHSA
jgi:hypothetical protein